MLETCFGEKERINYEDFLKIIQEVQSDIFLSIIALIRERLPCADNFGRFKRNFDKLMEKKA